VIIGRDIFPARRHIVPLITLLALLWAYTTDWAMRRGGRWRLGAWLVTPALLVCLGISSFRDPERTRAIQDTWHMSGRPVGRFLRQAFQEERPLLAVDAAGALPYYYRLPTLDMLGLNDRYIAEHPPENFGTGYVGHELGDGAYVLRRKPDLVIFGTPLGSRSARWPSGIGMERDPLFSRYYEFVEFETPPPDALRTQVWVRKTDSRVGIERSADRVAVPGFLFSSDSGGIARLDEQDRLGTTIERGRSARLGLDLPPGRWRARVSAGGDVRITVSFGSDTLVKRKPADNVEFQLGNERKQHGVRIEVDTGSEESAHLRRVEFERR